MNATTAPSLRVLKGTASAEELAALTMVLLRLLSGTGEGGHRTEPARARWQRLERVAGCSDARTWQAA